MASGNESEKVNHPVHYMAGGIEVIKYLESKLSPEAFEGFLIGNVHKYISRYSHKNGVEDLKKALWYLQKVIEEKTKIPANLMEEWAKLNANTSVPTPTLSPTPGNEENLSDHE